MAISQLVICVWQGGLLQETTVDNPTWQQIEAAIVALNNNERNDLYLYAKDTTWLGVGGGAGQYMLAGGIGDNLFPILVDPGSTSERKVSLTVGGQTADYPENQVHDLAQTLAAVRSFYELGKFSSSFHEQASWLIEKL